MPGLIREARDMQGIRKEAASKNEGDARPAAPPAGPAEGETKPSRPGKKS
jgi:hypothetical protein